MAGLNDIVAKAGVIASKAAETAKDLAGTAAVRTKQLSRIARLNRDISDKKDEIKKAYTELGKLYYKAHRADPEEKCAGFVSQIDEAAVAIAAMEEEIVRVKEEMAEKPQDPDLESVVDATEAEAEGTAPEDPGGEEAEKEPEAGAKEDSPAPEDPKPPEEP